MVPPEEILDDGGRGDFLQGTWTIRNSSGAARGFLTVWLSSDGASIEKYYATDPLLGMNFSFEQYTPEGGPVSGANAAIRLSKAREIFADWVNDHSGWNPNGGTVYRLITGSVDTSNWT